MLDSIKAPLEFERKKKPPKKKVILLLFMVLVLIIFGAFFYKTGFTFSKIITIKNIAWEKIFGELPISEEYLPPKDEDRINVLLLGAGGQEHEEGSLLTDSIVIISFKKSTGQIALISIPRDLYVQIPGEDHYEKVNVAYVLGLEKYGNGLDYAKKTIGYITGLYIDYAVAVDFEAFKETIDILGGVTIFLDEPFIEDKQWWCDENGENCRPFIVEAGDQILDGETALFYVRSRFSSSDFDRARRQQQIMLAIKDKILSLGILANPLIINELFNAVAKNVKIDIMPWELPSLIKLAQGADAGNIIRKVFDTSHEGLLYETKRSGIYILLPVDGNFDKIRATCQKIFD
jgi:LCP family protein required for cell wall assembly